MEKRGEEESIYSDDINRNAINVEERVEDTREDDAINDADKIRAESSGGTEEDQFPRSDLEDAERQAGSRAEPGEIEPISAAAADDELLEEKSVGPSVKVSRSTRVNQTLYFKVRKGEKESGHGPGES